MVLVTHLYKNGHHSTFEHIYFTFRIDGISRACSHQLVRHRHASYTQRSQRYCNEDGFGYVVPPTIGEYEFNHDMGVIAEWYSEYQTDGAPNEDARYILPNACETSLYMSLNLRELIHLCNERLCRRAQWEIRKLVTEMVALIDDDLKFMCVPKCQSGWLICNSPCKKAGG